MKFNPSQEEQNNFEVITVAIPFNMHLDLNKISAKHKISKQALIRQMVEFSLKMNKRKPVGKAYSQTLNLPQKTYEKIMNQAQQFKIKYTTIIRDLLKYAIDNYQGGGDSDG